MNNVSNSLLKRCFLVIGLGAGAVKQYGLLIGIAILLIAIMLPTPEGLTVAGQRMLGLLLFSIVIWMTEAVSYPVSAAIILSSSAFLLGLSLILQILTR